MRTAAMNQEIKRVLTEVLLKVPVVVCFPGLGEFRICTKCARCLECEDVKDIVRDALDLSSITQII